MDNIWNNENNELAFDQNIFTDIFIYNPFLNDLSLYDSELQEKENLNINNASLESQAFDFLDPLNSQENELRILIPNEITNNVKENLRGRKRRKNICEIHTKYIKDNVTRKILIHSINFLIDFINLILIKFAYNIKFYKIEGNFKKKEKKSELISIKKLNVGQILCQKISLRYTKQKNKNINMIVYKKVISNSIVSKLLSTNYLKIFKDIYCKKERIINLIAYGLNENIYIKDSIKMYIDLVNKYKEDYLYVEKLNECVNEQFLNY